jgi:hypothetical protein
MHNVIVEYDGGIKSATDEAIFVAAGYVPDGPVKCDSGCMLSGTYTRDLVFRYEDAAQAVNAAENLRKLPDVRVGIGMSS